MPRDYWINEHKHHCCFEDPEKTEKFYDVDARIDALTFEQKERFIKFVREMGDE
jgi:hypothetical protein